MWIDLLIKQLSNHQTRSATRSNQYLIDGGLGHPFRKPKMLLAPMNHIYSHIGIQ